MEKTIYQAIVQAWGEMKNPPKNAVNPHFKNRYADLASILEMSRPILVKNGLAIIQDSQVSGREVKIITRLIHESGEQIQNEIIMMAKSEDPQSIGGAITYGRRYSISAMLNISADDDLDGEENRPVQNQNQNQKSAQEKKQEKNPIDEKIGACVVSLIENQSGEGGHVEKAEFIGHVIGREIGEKTYGQLKPAEKEKIFSFLNEKGEAFLQYVKNQKGGGK